jgi:putative photosynthetic complex assembly protein
MSEIDKEPFPKFALYAAGVVVALAIGAAAIGRYNAVQNPVDPATTLGPVQEYVDLKFSDEADGAVIVKNAGTSALVLKILPGEDAFIRAVLRSFVRERVAMKVSNETPFRLYRLVDTRLVIEDPVTKKRVNLRAFGPTQQAAFARLLPTHSQK